MHRFRMYRRGNGWFYSEDVITRQQLSLRTKDRKEAQVLLSVKNEESRPSMVNLTLARIYLENSHPAHLSRTWNDVISYLIEGLREDPKRKDWKRFRESEPFGKLRMKSLFYTEEIHFHRVIRHPKATASTQRWLRQLRNFAMDMGWLLRPILSERSWPKIRPKPKRAITSEEHRRIVAAEPELERRLYYQMLWLCGGAQTDIAYLHRDCIDKVTSTICFQRKKMRKRNRGYCRIPIGEEISALLNQLPAEGWLFPTIQSERSSERAAKFKRVCRRLGIADITLHSYRYALAERAFWSGMPEAEAMSYLGHRNRNGHYRYAKNAPRDPMPLSFYEKQKAQTLLEIQKRPP